MTTNTDYLQETERRLIEWGEYYNAVNWVQLGYPKQTIEHSVFHGAGFSDIINYEVPAEILEIENYLLVMPPNLSRPLVCRYYYKNSDPDGAKRCHTSSRPYRDRIREGLTWIYSKIE